MNAKKNAAFKATWDLIKPESKEEKKDLAIFGVVVALTWINAALLVFDGQLGYGLSQFFFGVAMLLTYLLMQLVRQYGEIIKNLLGINQALIKVIEDTGGVITYEPYDKKKWN